jgi:allantoinase
LSRWALRGRRVYLPEGPRPASVIIEGEKILGTAGYDDIPAGMPVEEAGDLAVLPGLVDCHVHVNEPGRTEWEGFATATAAAAEGGIAAIVDMPLNCSPVTTTAAALETKLKALDGKLKSDVAFWGGLVPGNHGDLEGLAESGVVGFKCFLTHSGIDDFPNVTEQDLRKAMPVIAGLGLPLIVHAELDPCGAPGPDVRSFDAFLASRPPSMEVRAIRLMIGLCRETKCRVHIVHLSAAEALPDIEAAKAEGLPFTAETCPHYLTFAAEDVPPGATEYKCAPPIRSAENRELLWKALGDGVIDFVVSDHSPCAPELKKRDAGDFMAAWGGIAGLQFVLPATWTEAKRRGFLLEDVLRWTSERTAEFVGLEKGRIAPGRDADLLLFDDAALFDLTPERVRHRHRLTPYSGRRLLGEVRRRWLRGGEGAAGRPLLKRSHAWTSPRS